MAVVKIPVALRNWATGIAQMHVGATDIPRLNYLSHTGSYD